MASSRTSNLSAVSQRWVQKPSSCSVAICNDDIPLDTKGMVFEVGSRSRNPLLATIELTKSHPPVLATVTTLTILLSIDGQCGI